WPGTSPTGGLSSPEGARCCGTWTPSSGRRRGCRCSWPRIRSPRWWWGRERLWSRWTSSARSVTPSEGPVRRRPPPGRRPWAPDPSPEHVLVLGDSGKGGEGQLLPAEAERPGEEAKRLNEPASDEQEVPDVPVGVQGPEGEGHRPVVRGQL